MVNALIHRDYSIYGGSVNIAVYDDRLEVISVGTLPFGLTVEDLTRDHVSQPRNPYLADLFYRRGLIDAGGGERRRLSTCAWPPAIPPLSSRNGRGASWFASSQAVSCPPTVSATT